MTTDILIIAVVWIFAAFINGLTGMGGGLISLPIISLFVSSKSIIIITLIVGTMVGTLTLFLYWRHINFKEVAGFWIASLPGMYIGSYALKMVDMAILQLFLFALIVIHITVQLIQEWLGTCMAPRALMKYACGFLAGIFGGSVGLNGPIMAIYSSLMCMEKDRARGFFTTSTPATFFILLFAYRNGMVTTEAVHTSLWVAPAAIIGFLLALPLAKKIKQSTFHTAVLLLLAFSAVSLLFKAVPELFF